MLNCISSFPALIHEFSQESGRTSGSRDINADFNTVASGDSNAGALENLITDLIGDVSTDAVGDFSTLATEDINVAPGDASSDFPTNDVTTTASQVKDSSVFEDNSKDDFAPTEHAYLIYYGDVHANIPREEKSHHAETPDEVTEAPETIQIKPENFQPTIVVLKGRLVTSLSDTTTPPHEMATGNEQSNGINLAVVHGDHDIDLTNGQRFDELPFPGLPEGVKPFLLPSSQLSNLVRKPSDPVITSAPETVDYDLPTYRAETTPKPTIGDEPHPNLGYDLTPLTWYDSTPTSTPGQDVNFTIEPTLASEQDPEPNQETDTTPATTVSDISPETTTEVPELAEATKPSRPTFDDDLESQDMTDQASTEDPFTDISTDVDVGPENSAVDIDLRVAQVERKPKANTVTFGAVNSINPSFSVFSPNLQQELNKIFQGIPSNPAGIPLGTFINPEQSLVKSLPPSRSPTLSQTPQTNFILNPSAQLLLPPFGETVQPPFENKFPNLKPQFVNHFQSLRPETLIQPEQPTEAFRSPQFSGNLAQGVQTQLRQGTRQRVKPAPPQQIQFQDPRVPTLVNPFSQTPVLSTEVPFPTQIRFTDSSVPALVHPFAQPNLGSPVHLGRLVQQTQQVTPTFSFKAPEVGPAGVRSSGPTSPNFAYVFTQLGEGERLSSFSYNLSDNKEQIYCKISFLN